MEENEKNIGAGTADDVMPTPPAPVVPPAPTAADIGAELSKNEAKRSEVAAAPDKPQAVAPMLIDLANMTPEMMAQLKAALDNAPSVARPQGNNTVELRELDGKLVTGFNRAFPRAVFDPDLRAERTRQHIELTLMDMEGKIENKIVLYQDFMAAPRLVCEILKERKETKEKKLGMVRQRKEDGTPGTLMVPQMVTWNEVTLTIKDPRTGKPFDMNAEKVNQ